MDRSYLKTHPWIKFDADLRHAAPPFWVKLGECQSKCLHIAGVPLRPATAELLSRVYLAKGVLATTAIEGNTLSEEEVLQHLEGKLHLPASRQYLAQEIQNVIVGCNGIFRDLLERKDLTLTKKRIEDLNSIVLDKLTVEKEVIPGKVRHHEVGVSRDKCPSAADCDYLLDRLCEWMNGPQFAPQPGMEIVTAILKAVLAHLYLAWIHPFGDGNGRTARLVEFQILISSGVPSPAVHLLSNHYNQTRTEYYRQLDHASRLGGDVLPFVTYAAQGFLEGLNSQIELIRSQQWDITWRNYVHEAFADKKSPGDARRRRLVLDLSRQREAVPFAKLAEISPRVAASYAKRSPITLVRDMNVLLKMGLVEKDKSGLLRARKEIILAFLPPRASTSNAIKKS